MTNAFDFLLGNLPPGLAFIICIGVAILYFILNAINKLTDCVSKSRIEILKDLDLLGDSIKDRITESERRHTNDHKTIEKQLAFITAKQNGKNQ